MNSLVFCIYKKAHKLRSGQFELTKIIIVVLQHRHLKLLVTQELEDLALVKQQV